MYRGRVTLPGYGVFIENMLMQALGLATGGVFKYMLVVENGGLNTRGTMLLIFSLVIGCLLGQWSDIESKMENLDIKLKAAAKIKNNNRFVEGFALVAILASAYGVDPIFSAIPIFPSR